LTVTLHTPYGTGAAVTLGEGAHRTLITGLSVHGTNFGILVQDSDDVLIDDVLLDTIADLALQVNGTCARLDARINGRDIGNSFGPVALTGTTTDCRLDLSRLHAAGANGQVQD